MRALQALILSWPIRWTQAAPWSKAEAAYNFNLNGNNIRDCVPRSLKDSETATHVSDYFSDWPGHTYHPSPDNWRFPFYSMFLDRWSDGDPTNNEANGTVWEFDIHETQLRAGGDVTGFTQSLDYIESMGIRGIYVIGTIFQGLPWAYDGYSATDFTLIDKHTGTLEEWRSAVDEVHRRGMYIIFDMTVATMSDYIGSISVHNSTSYMNSSVPFSTEGYRLDWKDSVRNDQVYLDFSISNKTVPCPSIPVFYTDEGTVDTSYSKITCYDDDFNHYGDMEAFGVHPNWQRQLAKFASVQDRLQDWKPSVSQKLQKLGCMLIDALDADGFRLDKATQMTAPFLGDWSDAMRTCAHKRGKKNFFIPGEITGGNTYASAFVGRGRTVDKFPEDVSYSLSTTYTEKSGGYLRDDSKAALDSSAWSYTFYRYLEHFLGLAGQISGSYDVDYVSITNAVNEVFRTNDMVNANTGQIDARHMYGMTNHDIFRWPAILDGRIKSYLGVAMLNLLLPGIPLLYYGEEQDMLLLDNTAGNYLFGRQPMFSSVAWQDHGCYNIISTQYTSNVSFAPASHACHMDETSLDHFNPAHPVRNFHKQMYHLRALFPTLNEAFTVQINGNYSLVDTVINGNQSWYQGLWSVMRRPDKSQNMESGEKGQTIWFLYSNKPTWYEFKDWDCKQRDVSWTVPYPNLVAPYDDSTTVRNLLYPYEERKLSTSSVSYYNNKKAPYFGCLDSVTMEAFSMKVFVDTKYWKAPMPVITGSIPYHDQRILSNSTEGETIPFSLRFSDTMDCKDITSKLSLGSVTWQNETGRFSELTCGAIANPEPLDPIWASPRSAWHISGQISNIYNGIHYIDLQGNYTGLTSQMTSYSGKERFIFRVGTADNPMVFPRAANYSTKLLADVHDSSKVTLKHSAIGANKFRYSTNYRSSWSKWLDIESDTPTTVPVLEWSGTKKQAWLGTHIVVEYWSKVINSAHHYQHSDSQHSQSRRWPHLYAQGRFNHFLYDGALKSKFDQVVNTVGKNYSWTYNFMTEWPSNMSLNVWGLNDDEEPDHQFIYGDVDRDFVLDRVPPTLTQTDNVIMFNSSPPAPYLSWDLQVNDITRRYWYVPRGQRWVQIIIYVSLVFAPITCGVLAMLLYAGAFYRVKWNKVGVKESSKPGWFKLSNMEKNISYAEGAGASALATAAVAGGTRRKILIATLEYDIADLKIKIKIGGLGVMAQLMGNHLQHQDLIWVVPMVGDVEYPKGTLKRGEPFEVEINSSTYGVNVYYHILDNITYVLLSSPVFSKQTKSDPYPPRMDDLESAVFYSAWNQCIAKTCKRFPVDLYHINDYHGALAPLYLLPKVIPVALSLHNAEFQGLWPLRKPEERREVCSLFHTPEDVCIKYVQFGNVFNLLHAGVSFLRVHQQGFGAVGVSDKYGARSLVRYPIFWALKEIGKLPNPDPSDTGVVEENTSKKIEIDWEAENKRKDLKREAQEWAGLKVDPTAQLLVFVGRWSVQKGIDLIADLAPTLLEDFNVQLITIGPTVDLHGRFAAEKLAILMEKYPDRVCSKPVFTACPPVIFSGADFALIPSRDEPFGLVAVEFGRKGALGIGCKTGGLGTMPGWWYTMNSASASHLLSQFEAACRAALKSSEKVRAQLRARAAKQRFPVAVWVKRLDSLQSKCIHLSAKNNKKNRLALPHMEPVMDEYEQTEETTTADNLEPLTIETFQRKPSVLRKGFAARQPPAFVNQSISEDPVPQDNPPAAQLSRSMSLGSRKGPGSRVQNEVRHDGRLEALYEEENYDEDDQDSYSNGSEEAYYLREAEFEGRAPEERDFEQYLGEGHGNWHKMDPAASASTLSMANHLQQDDRAEWSGQRAQYEYYDSNAPSMSDQTRDGEYYDDELYDNYMEDYPRPPLQSHMRQESASHEGDTLLDSPSTQSPARFLGSDPHGPYMSPRGMINGSNRNSRLSVLSLTDLEKDTGVQQSSLRKGEAMFTDADGATRNAFVAELRQGITPTTSKKRLCIESFLMDAEREFFKRKKTQQIRGAKKSKITAIDEDEDDFDPSDRLRGMKRLLAMRGLGWPLYTIFMILGQVLAASAYQLTLLAGTFQKTRDIYIINALFAVMSVVWYVMYRRLPAYWTLSLPFVLYALAFAMIGLPYISRFSDLGVARNLTHSASIIYAAASASGSLYFALNFGAEGGVEVKNWVIRACIVQGLQQIWSACIWYWGAGLSDKTSQVYKVYSNGVPMIVAVVVWVLGFLLFFVFVAMLSGLPNYYRQTPGSIPAFYRSLYRRKVIMWFLFSQLLSNFWLALPYGRSWTYLWESRHLPTWGVVLLIIFFFILVWIFILLIIHHFTKTHTWAPVIFALGVIAPRYFAEFWAVSTIGMYLPWAPTDLASAILGRALWLWLTVLDSVQGAGIGIMLLSCMVRDHLAFTLICAQVIGALSTILAKAVDIPFSDYLVSFSAWDITQGAGPFLKPFFWICMICQLAIPVGFFVLFRKAQLAF